MTTAMRPSVKRRVRELVAHLGIDGPLNADALVARVSDIVEQDIVVLRVPEDPDRPSGLWFRVVKSGQLLLAFGDDTDPLYFLAALLHELYHILAGEKLAITRQIRIPAELVPDVDAGVIELMGARAHCEVGNDDEEAAELFVIEAMLLSETLSASQPSPGEEEDLDGLLRSLGY